ncbi:MAG: MurR/RpiR family transcriptional regulator [Synergistales bacterium]|jgi:DNA-binding MurR/RpiR family transcriptional regulator
MTGSPAEGSVLERISALAGRLSPKQHRLARHIFENCVPSSFLNITGLAAAAGVSESTVVRLAYSLGYDGFPELQHSLRQIAQEQISSLDTYPLDREENSLPLYRKVFNLEAALLKETAESLSEETFGRAIGMLQSAKHVLVVGTGPNRAIAEYFSFYLRALRPDVTPVTALDLELTHVLKGQSPKSLAVVFSFPRYPAATQQIAEKIRSRGIPVIGITDSALSPLAPLCDLLLESKMRFISFIDPSGATMALMHSLLIGLYLADPAFAKKQIRYFEDEIQREKTFLRPDLDIVDLL